MLSARTLSVLAVALVVIGAALVATRETQLPSPDTAAGTLLLPGLETQLNDVSRAVIKSHDSQTTLQRREGSWVVAEKADYPADTEKVRRLVIGVAGLTVIERKTSNPELFDRLGLVEPAQAGSAAVHVTLGTDSDAPVASVIVGNRQPSRANPGRQEIYVRLAGSDQTYLTEGDLPADTAPAQWLDTKLLPLEAKQLRTIRIEHGDGEVVTLSRPDADAADLQIEGLGGGESVGSPAALNSIASNLANLRLEDVIPAAEADMETEPGVAATATTFDGLQLQLRTARAGDKAYATVETSAAGAKENAVTQQAEALNQRFAGRAFVVPAFSLESIAKRRSELVNAAPEKEE